MKRAAVAAAIALIGLACGDSSDTAPSPAHPSERPSGAAASAGENEPPVLESAQLVPVTATSDDAVSVEVHVDDPDHDRLTSRYEWYRNGEVAGELHESYVPARTFARGDRVHVVVYVSDRDHEVSLQTADLTIQNAPPRVDGVSISPAKPTGQDLIEAEATGHDADSDDFTYDFRWFKNGQPIPNTSGPRLQPGSTKRGDQLAVQVVANDGTELGPPTTSAPIVIQNSSPQITSQPVYELNASGHYNYEVAAKDPDGDDPLRYELLQAPPGMTVDVTSGRISWTVPADAKGSYQIELAVSDGYGGKTLQDYALNLDWNETPASPGKGAESAAPKKGAKEAAAPARGERKPAAAKKTKPSDEDYTDQDQDQEHDQDQDQGEEVEEE